MVKTRVNKDAYQDYYIMTGAANQGITQAYRFPHNAAIEKLASIPQRSFRSNDGTDVLQPTIDMNSQIQQQVVQDRKYFSDITCDPVLGNLPVGYRPPGVIKQGMPQADLTKADIPINLNYIADPIYAQRLYIDPFMNVKVPTITGQQIYDTQFGVSVTA